VFEHLGVIVLLLVAAAVAAGQIVSVAGFVRTLRTFRQAPLADAACPRAAVVLCLRGPDPFLRDTVAAVLNQDYPSYQVVIVVDHRDDASWRVVQDAIVEHGSKHVSMQPLAQRLDTCSLKCSSLVQAVSSLDPSVEIVAQLDADTVPHATWLRELAGALADDRVAAATGNRWYMPAHATPGALVRYLWNVAAVVQMHDLGIAWGGTLAIKTRVIREAGLLDRWSRAFCEDTMLFAQLRDHGYQVRFVPSLMMVNRESCDLAGFSRWMPRQLLTARLYHPGWPVVVRDTFATTLLPMIAFGLCLASALRGDRQSALTYGSVLAGYQLLAMSLVWRLESAVRPVFVSRSQDTKWLSVASVMKMALMLPVTQAVSAWGIVSALRFRTVEWRGVTYSVGGPWQIRLRKYRPYVDASAGAIESKSL